ncbi:SAM dependent carboxyl methyltransferase [Parasponia andersonii]|uniref:SAM dependent carboxyl methyltransferase n=1 Tax=Parasponia andersonii TaxID=3476 RepID=A0A2P5A8S6_PARAD|nr:SAM dependent carboxyl methyltransferase [Parasponia andersonii]
MCGTHISERKGESRKAIEVAKELIKNAIAEELDIKTFTSKTFRIAGMGCSVGPNTLLAVRNIIDAAEHKFQSLLERGSTCYLPEFQVFFNDQASNDFNQLFTSLSPETHYFVAGVPVSFYGRVPEEVLDKRSPAWNRGRVHYSNSTSEVVKAFEAQYAKDFGKFLEVRAHEFVQGGLMALIIPGRPNGLPHSKAYTNKAFELLESSFIDMAKKVMMNDISLI